MKIEVPRRTFLASLGVGIGGLAVGGFPEARAKSAPEGGFRPNVFVHIATDGLVTIACARSEMGQGVRSTLPALIADELGADFARVKIVQADGDKAYGDQNTDGSSSIRKAFDDLRRTGAAARMMLAKAAAARWKVPTSELEVRDHLVTHARSQRSASFAELAADAARLPVPKKEAIVLRPRAELRTLGKALPFVDAPDIVRGRFVYGADVFVPGMLTAVIARPPVAGGRVLRHDATRTLAVAGVRKVVELPAPTRPFKFQVLGGIAVIADHTWAAMKGRAALEVTWDAGDNAAHGSEAYERELEAAVRAPGRAVRNVGDVDVALASATRRHEAVYHAPYLAHATMEPPVALAKVDATGCELWAPVQDPQTVRTDVAAALGLDESKVTVHVTMLGGGFGRKSKGDFALEAALLSREVGAPVRVQWTREDDIRHDFYHSVSAQYLEGGLDAASKVVAWRHRTAYPPIASLFSGTSTLDAGGLGLGFLDVPLAIPNVRGEACDTNAYTRIGWLRSVANIYHAWAQQSFLDELAHLRGLDPLANQLELLGPPKSWSKQDLGSLEYRNYGQSMDEHPVDTARHRRVLERVTTIADWANRSKNGRALGLAVHRSFLSYVAVIVSVRQSATGRIMVDEAWVVADAGTIVNAERVHSQLEGALVFGLSLALYGEISMKDGATQQSNFRDYRLLRMNEAPRAIHVEVIESDAPPAGVGEPGVPPVAPAVTNAIFALTGQRIRKLPVARSLDV